jgi:hypothetical protein
MDVDADSGKHRRIEADAEPHGIVTIEELVSIARRALAWQLSNSRRQPMQQFLERRPERGCKVSCQPCLAPTSLWMRWSRPSGIAVVDWRDWCIAPSGAAVLVDPLHGAAGRGWSESSVGCRGDR